MQLEKLVERCVRVSVRLGYPDAQARKGRVGNRIAVRTRRHVVVAQVKVRIGKSIDSYLTLPDGERRWERMNP